jgi:hypothetical protein
VVWRDVWDGTPGVVVLAEGDAQDGVLSDAVLLLSDDQPSPVTVTRSSGEALILYLPETSHPGPAFHTGVDLTVEHK